MSIRQRMQTTYKYNTKKARDFTMAKCTSISLLEHDDNLGDVLRVVIDGTTQALWFFPYAEALKYVDQEVVVSYGQGMHKGNLEQVIATFAVPTAIATLDKHENIRLYSDAVDNASNVNFKDIAPGETRMQSIVFCISSTYKSSPAAVWHELTIRDCQMHVAKLRLFSPESTERNYTGQYIMCALERYGQGGFKTNTVAPVPGDAYVNPEVAIAETYIRNVLGAIPAAVEYINKVSFIDNLKNVVDIEPGYVLVRLAMTLSMLENLTNITGQLDVQSMMLAAMCRYGHHCRPSSLSASSNSLLLALNFQFPDKVKVCQILDPEPVEDVPLEREILESIEATVDNIIFAQKGTKFDSYRT